MNGGRMAMCPVDNVPLIATFAFSGAEFYCLDCGGHFGWLQPVGAEPTPDLDADYEARKAEWYELAGPALIGGGAMLKDCPACKGEEHWRHATGEERAAHEAALARLVARVTAGAAR